MPPREWHEVPVFLHGITSDREPQSHAETYLAFLSLVNEALAEAGKEPFTEAPIMVEWGWEASLGQDKCLAEAERLVAAEVLPPTAQRRGISLNPLRRFAAGAREAFLFGVADLFYYVSADGSRAVRDNVFRHLAAEIDLKRGGRGSRFGVSLTFVGHSAGTIIAHDFLYRLFGWGARPAFGLTFNKVRRLKQRGRLRVRRFYTLGSPIAPFIFRSEALIGKIVNREKLNPEVIGLCGEDGLANPRWVNFWTPSDLLSYPVSFLYDTVGGEAVVVDERVDLGESFPGVHSAYWRSEAIAAAVAENF
jgi:hypothetical protein